MKETLKKFYAANSNAKEKKNGGILLVILSLILRVAQIIFHFLLSLVYSGPGDSLPPTDNLILLDSASALAQKIRNRKLTSVEVVQSFINRIKEINPILNVAVDNRFKDALDEAKKADEYILSSGKTKEEIAAEYPFLGVPFSAKDCVSVKGLSYTGGLYHRKNVVGEKDAHVIACMRSAGAIPLVVTNVSELCLWWESYNKVYGRTRNPYNTNHIVGGSSGGEGCLNAAAGIPMGIGTDIGGSVRIPAFFNGVFGHKSSPGVGSLEGQYPLPREELQRSFLTAGPISRFASDLLPMLKVIGPDQTKLLQLDKKVDITKLKYYFMEDDGGGALISPVEPEIKQAIKNVVTFLKGTHGIVAERVNLPSLKDSMSLWFAKMKAPSSTQLAEELANNEGSVNVLMEILKLPFGLSKHTFPVLSIGVLEQINYAYGSEKHKHLLNKCDNLKLDFLELLGTNGVFIYPTHPTAAPYHIEPIVKPFNVAYTAIFNVLGMPSTHVPMGLNSKGLPIGLQVVASPNHDRLTIAVAQELERAFGGWVNPAKQ